MTAPAPASSPAVPPPHVALSLAQVFATVRDPRAEKGRRHPLSALLALLLVSFLTGKQTVKDAVLLGRHFPHLRTALGFEHSKCPSQSTYTRLFHVLAIDALRQPLLSWLASLAELRRHKARPMVACVDGKTICGAGVHTLNIFAQDYWMLLDQIEVADGKGNEMTTLRERIEAFFAKYPFVRILTMDAMFCESETMEKLTKNNRLGIFQVKGNQPTAAFEVERIFRALLHGKTPDYQESEKKWGLHRDARGVGAPRLQAAH
jgi:hypothetical protein